MRLVHRNYWFLPPSITRNCRRRSGAVVIGVIGLVANAASIKSPIVQMRSAMWRRYLDLFIKKMQRRAAGIPPHVLTGEEPPKTFLGGGEDDEAAN
jgi:hypothetical protein